MNRRSNFEIFTETGVTFCMTTDKQESFCDSLTSLSLSRLRDLNRGSEWDFGSEKDIRLIALFWIINNCVRNEGKVKPMQTWTP